MSTPPASAASGRRRLLVVLAAIVVVIIVVVVFVFGRFTSSTTSTAPTLYGHAGAVNNNTPVQAPPIPVASGSLIVVFLGWVNGLAAGGNTVSISDSLFDDYHLAVTSGLAYNHSEAVYVASPATASTSLVVSVQFEGGALRQGGSVAVIDVSNANLASVDGTNWSTGDGPTAIIALDTNHSGDLVLFGAAGRGVSGPFTAASGETLLDTGTGVSGPAQDGSAFGTFSAKANGSAIVLTAGLSVPTYWVTVAIAIR